MLKKGTALWIAAILAAVLLAVLLAWVLFVPAADWLAQHDVGKATGSSLETARNNARGNLLALTAGIAGFGALLFTARNFALQRRTLELAEEGQRRAEEGQRRTLELTEQGQVTERYTKAIEQLGSEKLDIRIGGIYALERIARDSARDHPTVMEVLSAFIREHSPANETPAVKDAAAARPAEDEIQYAKADIQAALSVIGRRQLPDLVRIKLPRTNLSGGDLIGANFTGAILAGADLIDVDLTSANLADSDLTTANLYNADLTKADLAGAFVTEANLTKANLYAADLTNVHLYNAILADAHLAEVILTDAILADADLARASLAGANLTRTDLSGADLTYANLTGANLTDAILDGADLRGATLGSPDRASLLLPAGWRVGEYDRIERDPSAEVPGSNRGDIEGPALSDV